MIQPLLDEAYAQSAPAERGLPAWFDLLVLAAVLVVAWLGFVASVLAQLQMFTTTAALAMSAAGVGVSLWVLAPHLRRPAMTSGAHGAAAVAVVFVVAVTVFNVVHAAEHLLIGRDPGISVVAARQLATEGDFVFPAVDHGLASTPGFEFTAGGQYRWAQAATVPQGLHLLPALLAVAWGVGGTGWLLAGTPVVGGIALLAFFALGARLVPPWWALVATVTLGVSLPQIHFARDAFTEIPLQVFVFGSLWAMSLASARSDRRFWMLGGALAGLMLATRLDGMLIFAPLLVAVALRQVGVVGEVAPGALRSFWIGAATPIALAVADMLGPGRPYVAGRAVQTMLLVGLFAECVILSRAIVARGADPERMDRWRQRLDSLMPRLAVVVPVLLLVAWFVPPFLVGQGLVEPRTARVQTYGEYGLARIALFYGPWTLAAALVGIGMLLRDLRGRPPALLVLLAAIPTVGLYVLWNPFIFPDLPWAMRRFLPIVLPAVLLAAVVAVEALVQFTHARLGRAAPVIAVLAVSGLLVTPIVTTWPIADLRRFDGTVAAVETVCDALPPDTVVAFSADEGTQDVTLAPAVAAFCEVPVIMYAPTERRGEPVDLAPYGPVAAAVEAAGGHLTLLSRHAPEGADAGRSRLLVEVEVPNLVWEYSRSPSKITPWPIRVVATRVDANAGGDGGTNP